MSEKRFKDWTGKRLQITHVDIIDDFNQRHDYRVQDPENPEMVMGYADGQLAPYSPLGEKGIA